MASTGEFVCFLNGDDSYLPERLSACIQALKSRKKYFGGIYCGYLEWSTPENDLNRYPETDLFKYLLTLEYNKHYIHASTVTYRFAELIKINGFDESYIIQHHFEFNLRFLGVSDLTALEKPFVRLKAKTTGQNNHQSNLHLFKDKARLLAEFQSVISNYDESVSELIFNAHLSELLRSRDNRDALDSDLASSLKINPTPQALTSLKHQPEKGARAHEVSLLRKLAETQLALEISRQQLEAQTQHVKEIETSLTWRISKLWRHPILARLFPFR
jgi:hypothetical protein